MIHWWIESKVALVAFFHLCSVSFQPWSCPDIGPWALVLVDIANHILTIQLPKLPSFPLNWGGGVFAWLVDQSLLWLDVLKSTYIISQLKILGLGWPFPPLNIVTWHFEGLGLQNMLAFKSYCHLWPMLRWLLLQLWPSIGTMFLLDLALLALVERIMLL